MSAADGMLSAVIAISCAWTASSRASKAHVTAPVNSGFSSRSDSALPSRSSPDPARRSRRLLSASSTSDICLSVFLSEFVVCLAMATRQLA